MASKDGKDCDGCKFHCQRVFKEFLLAQYRDHLPFIARIWLKVIATVLQGACEAAKILKHIRDCSRSSGPVVVSIFCVCGKLLAYCLAYMQRYACLLLGVYRARLQNSLYYVIL